MGAVAARVLLWAQGGAFSLPSTLPLMGVAAVMVVFLYFFQPTLCGPAGLKVMNSWGLRRTVAWNDIAQVGLARLHLVQPSLKLVDRQGRAYWIARDTRDLRGLHALSKAFGGVDHPLTLALETPLHQL